jgi:hypothetical protein
MLHTLAARLAQPLTYTATTPLRLEQSSRLQTNQTTDDLPRRIPVAALGVDIGSVSTKAALVTEVEGQVRLLGADVTPPGGTCCGIAGLPQGVGNLTVTLWWEGTGKAQADYQVFVHLVNAEGRTATQSDHLPGGEFYPSSLWQAGEILRDVHRLATPPPGEYELLVGMYRAGGQRLGDAISLGKVVF